MGELLEKLAVSAVIILLEMVLLFAVAYAFMLMINVLAGKFGFPKFDYWESLIVVIGIELLVSLLRFNVEVNEE